MSYAAICINTASVSDTREGYMLLTPVMVYVFSTSSDSIDQVWREREREKKTTKGVTFENQQGFYNC